MSEARDQLEQKLNNRLAAQSTTQQNREIIGLLCTTIQTLGEEIDELEEQLAEVQENVEQEQKKRKWYTER
ncbi:hypothetical protein [Haladaptatus sp. DFWS20]|uniref:hypothetical protein n=1 Tax=Haladaptatus sp. DFWS20 TaxID=3403467 RepID=UPI003EC068B1